jgi:hypothetical protein
VSGVPTVWNRRTFAEALDFALVCGDEDDVAALLAMRQVQLFMIEAAVWCPRHRDLYQADDGCYECARESEE